MVDRAKHYPPAAYQFVRQGLDYALRRIKKRRHISGQELLKAISVFAKQRFGPLAREVFFEWGITETLDFGYIVFDLVEKGIMTRRPEDSLEDFRDGYDFREEFDRGYDYLAELRKEQRRPSSPIEINPDEAGAKPDLTP